MVRKHDSRHRVFFLPYIFCRNPPAEDVAGYRGHLAKATQDANAAKESCAMIIVKVRGTREVDHNRN
jgi:hypothetical protein